MNDERFNEYNLKRNELIKKYKMQKIKNIFLVLGIGAAIVALIITLFLLTLINEAVAIVLSAVVVMITIIFTRIRVVTINHIRDEKLRLFEEDDPTFR